MAIGNWIMFDKAKQKVWNGGLDLDTDTIKVAFFRTSAALTRASGSIWSQLVGEISATGGYASHGYALAGLSVKAGTSAGQTVFTHAAKVISAVAGALTNIRYAVLVDESKGTSGGNRPIIGFCALSTAQFTVTSGNTITLNPPTPGVFDLTGATA
ncbi:MAG: hypothetical protein ABFD60_01630 [Bryobacteraceae bacterium]